MMVCRYNQVNVHLEEAETETVHKMLGFYSLNVNSILHVKL